MTNIQGRRYHAQTHQRNALGVYKWLANNFPKSHEWNNAMRNLIYRTDHLNNQQRFTAFTFFYNNGVNPTQSGELVKGLCKKVDADAYRQIEWLKQKTRSPTWNYKSHICKSNWDIGVRR
jgi:hypothetical protein